MLDAAREAADLYRSLVEESPAAYTPDLAGSLNNLSAFLSDVGERDRALDAAREAADLYRSLVEESPAAYTPDLAMALNNLATFLSEAGKRGQALEIFTENFERFSPVTRARLFLVRASWRHDNQEEDERLKKCVRETPPRSLAQSRPSPTSGVRSAFAPETRPASPYRHRRAGLAGRPFCCRCAIRWSRRGSRNRSCAGRPGRIGGWRPRQRGLSR